MLPTFAGTRRTHAFAPVATRVQTMNIIYRLRLAWPRSFRSLLAVGLYFNIQLDLSSARPECMFYWNNYPSYHVYNVAVISALPGFLVFLYLLRLPRLAYLYIRRRCCSEDLRNEPGQVTGRDCDGERACMRACVALTLGNLVARAAPAPALPPSLLLVPPWQAKVSTHVPGCTPCRRRRQSEGVACRLMKRLGYPF